MSMLPYIYDFDRPFRMMDCHWMRPEFNYPFDRMIPSDFFRRDEIFNPWQNVMRPWRNLMQPMEELSDAMRQLAMRDTASRISSDDEKFQINVDVQHFTPDEISVKVIDKHVVVEGKHEEKKDQHGYVSRRFVRRYELPQGCLPDTVESNLSSDGVLTVTAPKVLAMPSTGERIVPITHTGPVKKQISEPNAEPNSESKAEPNSEPASEETKSE